MGNWKFTLFGVFVLLIGGWLFYLAIRHMLKCKVETEGTIVSVERKHMNKKNNFYPVVEFLADGKTITKTADISSRLSTKFKTGSTLTVRYNENDPEEFVIKGKSFREDFFGGIFLIVVGIFCIVMSL